MDVGWWQFEGSANGIWSKLVFKKAKKMAVNNIFLTVWLHLFSINSASGNM